MDAISAWVRGIVAVVLLMTFIEMAAPRGELKKYIDIVIGIAVIGAILGPIAVVGLDRMFLHGLESATEYSAYSTPVTTQDGWNAGPGMMQMASPDTPSAAAPRGQDGPANDLACALAERVLESRARQALFGRYGDRAATWDAQAKISPSGQLESVKVWGIERSCSLSSATQSPPPDSAFGGPSAASSMAASSGPTPDEVVRALAADLGIPAGLIYAR